MHLQQQLQWYEVKVYPQQFPVADDPFTDIHIHVIIITSRYPVGISTEFCFRWQGVGDKGGKGGGGGGGEWGKN